MRHSFLYTVSIGVMCLFSQGVQAKSPVVLTTLVPTEQAIDANQLRMLADLKKETGIELQYKAMAGDNDASQKLQIIAGEPHDLVYLTNTNSQEVFSAEGLVLPLEQMAAKAGVDLKAIFGRYLRPIGSHIYFLPSEMSMQVVFYNKEIFDKAGVPYPRAGWTWNDYVSSAKKLTKPSQKIWGSLMQNWEYFQYIGAHQRGINDFKADGSANFDHPAFKEALKWFGDLGAKEKIQPSWKAMAQGEATWHSMLDGRFAMTYNGSWHLVLFADTVNYPRTWKFGIAPPPIFPGYKNAQVAGAAFAVTKNSRHPEEAFRAITWLASNGYKYTGNIPALASLDRQSFRTVFQPICETRFKGDISADDLFQATLGNGLEVVQEKITGPAGPDLNKMYQTEGEKYLVGWQSLDETMALIQKKANEILAKRKAPLGFLLLPAAPQ